MTSKIENKIDNSFTQTTTKCNVVYKNGHLLVDGSTLVWNNS